MVGWLVGVVCYFIHGTRFPYYISLSTFQESAVTLLCWYKLNNEWVRNWIMGFNSQDIHPRPQRLVKFTPEFSTLFVAEAFLLLCLNVSFDFNVSYSSCWGYSLINTFKLKKNVESRFNRWQTRKTEKGKVPKIELEQRSLLRYIRQYWIKTCRQCNSCWKMTQICQAKQMCVLKMLAHSVYKLYIYACI